MSESKENTTLINYIKESRKSRFIANTNKFVKLENETDTIICIPEEITEFILMDNESTLVTDFKNEDSRIYIPKDESNRFATLYVNNTSILINLETSVLTYDYIEGIIILTVNKYTRDTLIDTSDEIYTYPIYDLEFNQLSNNKYEGIIKAIIAPFNESINLIKEEGSLGDLLSSFGYYKSILEKVRTELIYLFHNADNTYIYIERKLYVYKGIKDYSLIVSEYNKDDITFSIDIKDYILLEHTIIPININSVFLYKKEWYNINPEVNTSLLGTDYENSAFRKLDILIENIDKFDPIKDKEIYDSLIDTYNAIYDNITNSGIFDGDKKFIYIEEGKCINKEKYSPQLKHVEYIEDEE